MFENFDEIMDETMEELQENETMEQDNAFENGNAEVSPEEAEAVGRGEYSPEARTHAWNEYNRLSGKDRETFLRGHSRNAHIMNMELRNEQAGSTTGESETAEEKESVGYSSDYYKHELATAKNDIQRDYALKNYRAALARETVGSTTGEGEAAETAEEQESVGYSSDYYKHELATAKNDIQRDYALKNYRAALARETVGSTTGEGEAAETAEEQESVGYSSDYYEHQMASALKNGNKIAYDNARSNWAKAKVRESVGSTTGAGEVDEASEDKEAAGYSSDYYKHELATAKNDIQRDYALKNYRAALARETVGSTTGEGEAAETTEDQETVGYSSSYYEHEMASALKNGNRIAYDNARSNWAKAKVRESVGSTTGTGEGEEEVHDSQYYEKQLRELLNPTEYHFIQRPWTKSKDSTGSTTGEGEAVNETKEAVGSSPQFWLNKATKDLAEGHMTAHKINMDRYYEALVKESVGYRAEDGSIIEGLDPNERHGQEKRK